MDTSYVTLSFTDVNNQKPIYNAETHNITIHKFHQAKKIIIPEDAAIF